MSILLITQRKFSSREDAVAHCQSADMVWHLDESMVPLLRAAGVAASFRTRDLIPEAEQASLRPAIAHWLDALGGRLDDPHSLRAATNAHGYALWEPVRQSLYSNFRNRIRIDRLLFTLAGLESLTRGHPEIRHVICREVEPAVFSAAALFVRQRRPAITMERTFRHEFPGLQYHDVLKWVGIEVFRTAKELLQQWFIRSRRLKRDATVIVTYAPLIRDRTRTDITGMSMLQDELQRAGRPVLNVVIDYSTSFSPRRHQDQAGVVPFEAFFSPAGWWQCLRYAIKMLAGWRKVVAGWRRHNSLVFHGTDTAPVLLPYLWYYSWVFIPKSAVYLKAFRELCHIRPRCFVMIGEYSRLGQCAIIAAQASSVPFCALQHGRIDRNHHGYFPATESSGARFPLPDAFCVFGHRDLRLLQEINPVLASRSHVTGYLNHDHLHGHLLTPRDALRQRLRLRGDRLVVALFDNDNNPAILAEMLEELELLHGSHGVQFILHPHPRSVHPVAFFHTLMERTAPHARYTGGQDSYVVMAASDVLLVPSGASTTLAEAVACGRKAYFAAWRDDVSAKRYEGDIAQPLYRREFLREEIAALVEQGFVADIAAVIPEAADCFSVDGQVARRIAGRLDSFDRSRV